VAEVRVNSALRAWWGKERKVTAGFERAGGGGIEKK